MKSDEKCDCEDVCNPILTIDQLLNGHKDAFRWCDKVEPLFERSAPRFLHNKYFSMDYGSTVYETEMNRPEVLVCHDYQGNYLDDKYNNGTSQFEEYRFYNWNCIDTFCYFSHNLVTLPTLQYLNAAHKNGVKVLGTLIIEGTSGYKALHREILSSKDRVEHVVKSLVDLSKRLKFEGWLLNIETVVEVEQIPMLKHFVELLTSKIHKEIPNGKVIWYDSVLATDGKLLWQNELNQQNEAFFTLSDGIFTNYNWSIQQLERTSKLIDTKYPNRRQDVFFGIDVFGRGQIAGFRCSETLSKSSAFKFSTAIFAPAWTCETIDIKIGFEGIELGSSEYRDRMNQTFLERNDRFWSSMYPFFYMFGPKTLPFVTNFCIGSGKRLFRMGRELRESWFNLKYQSIQPSTPSQEGFFSHYYEDAFDGGSSISVDTMELIRIYVCELPCADDIIFSYTFKRNSESNDLQVNLNVLDVKSTNEVQLVCAGANGTNPFVLSCLAEDDVRSIAVFLANNRQTFVPSKINGWETRYYILKFNKTTQVLITDIGIKKKSRGKVLLGQMAFRSAKNLVHDFVHINVVHF